MRNKHGSVCKQKETPNNDRDNHNIQFNTLSVNGVQHQRMKVGKLPFFR